ncbi:MAG TPA: 4'-phosphopantetheinyl transferase superfamily protein [Streptosporangiaceae bacterium]
MTDLVRVWIIPRDVPPEIAAKCSEVLDDRERARAAAFLTSRDRQQFVIAHGALRILLGRELNTPAQALIWTAGEHGKPELAPPWSALCTSLSHSAGLIAVAASAQRPVGVDIQHLLDRLDPIALSARFFPPDEAGYVAAGPDVSTRADRFTHLWARKEAVVKAAGGRLWPNLAITVRNREIVSCTEPASRYRVADVTAPTGFRAAVALSGGMPFVAEVGGWPTDVAESAMA